MCSKCDSKSIPNGIKITYKIILGSANLLSKSQSLTQIYLKIKFCPPPVVPQSFPMNRQSYPAPQKQNGAPSNTAMVNAIIVQHLYRNTN